MEKQLYKLIDQYCKSQETNQSLRKDIKFMMQSRADMPKHFFIHVHKIFLNKSQYSMINVLDLIQFILMNSQLPFYSQLATKELCFKLSNLITSKQTQKNVKNKCLELVSCMEQTLRPHSDLLPHAFQFIQSIQSKGQFIPRDYRSIYAKHTTATNNSITDQIINQKQTQPMIQENLLDIQNPKKQQQKQVDLLDLQNANPKKIEQKPSAGIFDLLDMNTPSQPNPNDFMTEYDMNQQDNNNKFMNLI